MPKMMRDRRNIFPAHRRPARLRHGPARRRPARHRHGPARLPRDPPRLRHTALPVRSPEPLA